MKTKNPTPIAVLSNDNGEEYHIAGTLINSVKARGINGEGHQTYAFDVPIPYADHNDEVTDTDSSISVRATLKIYYKNKGTTPDEYLLTRISGNYNIIDPQVQVGSSKVMYACNGLFPETVNNQRVELNLSGNSFDYYTNFTKYVTEEDGLIGAKYTLNLKRGTSSKWTFIVDNYFSDILG